MRTFRPRAFKLVRMTRRFSARALGACLAPALFICGATCALAAAGDVDPTFNPGAGPTSNAEVLATAVQPDGKVLIAGGFTQINGVTRNRVARLHADGSLDTSFLASGSGADSHVRALALQPDGKVLVGGFFTAFHDVPRNILARLNADGSLDASFTPAVSGLPDELNAITLQPDGKILIAGRFSSVKGVPRGNVARLHPDGSLDTSFLAAGAGTQDYVYTVVLQPDGKVLLGGGFNFVNGVSRRKLARLNADGSLDASFLAAGSGADADVWTIFLQPDGKILVGGNFSQVNGVSRRHIARLDSDGSVDASFSDNLSLFGGASVRALALQPDGKVLIGGNFITGTGSITRFNSNGSFDPTFQASVTGQTSVVHAITLQADGKIIIGGDFNNVSGTPRNGVARLAANGPLDSSFAAGRVTINIIRALALQPDGKVLVGGFFNAVSGTPRTNIARLNADGSLDSSFSGPGPNDYVEEVAVQPDGKVLIGGWFTNVGNSSCCNRIARLNADGSLDTSFLSASGGTDATVYSIVVQPDGKIIIGGTFNSVNGVPRANVARLNQDGSVDPSFNASTSDVVNGVRALALQADGRVLVGGGGNSQLRGIARLNPDGSLDNSFNGSGTGINSGVITIALQADGKVLIGGQFTSVNGAARDNVARLNSDGSLDDSFFATVAGESGLAEHLDVDFLRGIVAQPDGRVVIVGDFISVNGTPRRHVARLKSDGSIDETFLQFTSGANAGVYALALQPDGRVLVGGHFSLFNNVARGGVARLTAAQSPNPIDTPTNFVIQHYRDFLNREPDAAGLAFWTNQTTNCGNPDLLVCRINVSAAFFLSIEFQETGYLAYRTHKLAFDAGPTLRRSDFLSDQQALSAGVVIGQPGALERLEANKQAYFNAFVNRQAFLDRYPTTMPPAQFVDALNANSLDPLNPSSGGSLSPAERDALVASLTNGTTTRAQVLRAVAEDADFAAREKNRAFVLMQYYGYLRRNPNDSPEPNLDFGGYNFWLTKLNDHGGDFIAAEMVKAFITAGEYRDRFGTN